MADFFTAWQLTVSVPVSTDVPVTQTWVCPSYEEARAALVSILDNYIGEWCHRNGVVDDYIFPNGKLRYDALVMFALNSDLMRTTHGTTLLDYRIEELSFEQLVELPDN